MSKLLKELDIILYIIYIFVALKTEKTNRIGKTVLITEITV